MTTNPQPVSSPVDGKAVVRKVRKTILPIVFLLYAFNYMDRSSISYAQLTMGSELGIDVATYGAIAAIFFLAYVLLEVPSNIILARVGARVWLARIAITWGLVTVATGFVHSVTQLYVARILLGIAEAGLFPGLILFLTFWFLNHDRGRAIGVMALAMPFALIVGSLSGGLILDHVDWFGLSSWRWIFILQGLPPVLLGVWILLTLADRPNKAKWLNADEKNWLENSIADEYAAMPEGDQDHSSELKTLKNRKVLYLGLINALAGVATYGMTFFLPQVVSQLNPEYSPTSIGIYGAIPYVCGAIVMLLLVRYADISGRRKPIVLFCFATAIVGLVTTGVFRDSPLLGMIGLILLACGVIGNIPTYWALISEVLTKRQAVVGIAVINSLASAGGFFGPFLIGKIATPGDIIVGMSVPLVALTLAFVLLLFVKVPQRDPFAVAGSRKRKEAESTI
ncbi:MULTISPECIES: MFS transporter [unclassified Rhodococcus (in: high G+C Gram-positive bacteria)]|uniref:MFS transporter n=1 Tax=unclassified Rhodococcus (in: high G+C Gram-positive bacteria) TaxID=192944 RepID=UPI00211AEF0C|nr:MULTISPECIES: MFS transporter [unclassified Rhodococcus (in: high G+C Gram-positive bacteria)]